MKLQPLKQIEYISPSSFLTWKRCQFRVFLEKCSGIKLPEESSTPQAALGTVFDIVVKSYVAAHLDETLDTIKLWQKLHLKVEHAKVITLGINLANIYMKRRIVFDRILNLITSVDMIGTTYMNGIPIFGYPDGVMCKKFPLDWKTRGFGASYNVSPKPGYAYCYNITDNIWHRKQHKRCNEPLDHRFEDWATQILFYWWMINPGGDAASPHGWIEEVIAQNPVIVAHHQGEISDEFVDKTKADLERMWDMVCSGDDFEEPEPNDRRCKPYNSLCRVAEHCNFYQKDQDFNVI